MRKLTKEREAMFLAAQHCQGGHSEAGMALSEALGVPFPVTMGNLVAKLRDEGQNPAAFYPWLIKAQHVVSGPDAGTHPYFTAAELDAASALAAQTGEA